MRDYPKRNWVSGVAGDLRAFVVWRWAAVRNQSRAPLRLNVAFDCEVRKLSLKALDLDLCERHKLNIG